MGHQSYVIPYDSEEEKEAILDAIRKHNSDPFCNEFVRYSNKAEYAQLLAGEVLTRVMTVTVNEPYKTLRTGPTLSKAVLCGHGGGRGCTFFFLDWELRRRLSNPAITAYGFERSMEKRMVDNQVVPQERVGGDCALGPEAYDVRPAFFITRKMNYTGSQPTADQPYPPISYETKEEGYVVAEQRFSDKEAAESYSAEEKRKVAEYRAKEEARIAANTDKYKELRAAGKDYYTILEKLDGGGFAQGRKWLTEEAVAAKRSEPGVQIGLGKLLANDTVLTTAEIDLALAAGEQVKILYL